MIDFGKCPYCSSLSGPSALFQYAGGKGARNRQLQRFFWVRRFAPRVRTPTPMVRTSPSRSAEGSPSRSAEGKRWNIMKRPNPVHPRTMKPEERLAEIFDLLAHGCARLCAAESDNTETLATNRQFPTTQHAPTERSSEHV